MFNTNEEITREGNNMKVEMSTNGKIVVKDIPEESISTVLNTMITAPVEAMVEFKSETASPDIEDDFAEDVDSQTNAPEPQDLTVNQLAHAYAKLSSHKLDYDLVLHLLEEESVDVEQVLALIPDWEDRLLVADVLIDSGGWHPTPDEERELRHAAADIISRGCTRKNGEALNRYQMIVVGVYACDDHRAAELVGILDPYYNARVEDEEREVESFVEDVDENNGEAEGRRHFLDGDHDIPYLYGDL